MSMEWLVFKIRNVGCNDREVKGKKKQWLHPDYYFMHYNGYSTNTGISPKYRYSHGNNKNDGTTSD